MRERPIIFSTDMIKAVLNGAKSQTRRVIKPQPELIGGQYYWKHCSWTAQKPHCPTGTLELAIDYCPYGQVGDRLWVRETFNKDFWDNAPYTDVTYKTDWLEWLAIKKSLGDFEPSPIKWIPAIYMPRWASRITLEIIEVRVERVQEITEEDCFKEGITNFHSNFPDVAKVHYPIHSFQQLWDSLNAKRGFGWEVNPWIWCISFKPVR